MEISYEDFKKVIIKVGTVLEVKKNEKARKPSLVIKVDFGKEVGIKQSSAQITHYYNPENLTFDNLSNNSLHPPQAGQIPSAASVNPTYVSTCA